MVCFETGPRFMENNHNCFFAFVHVLRVFWRHKTVLENWSKYLVWVVRVRSISWKLIHIKYRQEPKIIHHFLLWMSFPEINLSHAPKVQYRRLDDFSQISYRSISTTWWQNLMYGWVFQKSIWLMRHDSCPSSFLIEWHVRCHGINFEAPILFFQSMLK